LIKEFRAFISRGNVLDLAVGIVIGAAFGAIVGSFVNDIIMPPIGLLLGNVDFSSLFLILKVGTIPGPYATPALAKAAGAVTLNYGVFIMTIINFLIIAFAVFLVVKAYNNMQKKPAPAPAGPPTTKECPFCFSTIPIKATRCPNCTSELKK
jgi:large conductance mechanosensitive channel